MTLATLFTLNTSFFWISFALGILSPQIKSRRVMLSVKAMADAARAMYLLTQQGLAGACGALIASIGAFSQAATPQHYMRKTVWLRIGLACILSGASIYFVYKTPIDILPISMVILCRFGELQTKAQRVRFVYWITCFPWMYYYAANHFYLPLGAIIITNISLLVGIWRHHRSEPTNAFAAKAGATS